MNNPNDGGPISLDSKSNRITVTTCETFRFSLEVLPLFLIQIMPGLPPLSGGWERTVTFTAREQELRALVACFIASSQGPNRVKKFTIETKINWITNETISKEQRHQIIKNSTILGQLLQETGRLESTHLEEHANTVGRISFLIQTTEVGRNAAGKDAQSCWPLKPELPSDLRDWFAGMALQGYRAANVSTGGAYPSENCLQSSSRVAKWAYDDAQAMLKARASHLGRPVAATEPPNQPKPPTTAPSSPQGEPDPGEGWFLLATGMPLQPGDGFFYPQGNCWVDFDCRPDIFRGSKALKLPKKDFVHTWPWRRKTSPQGTTERGEGV